MSNIGKRIKQVRDHFNLEGKEFAKLLSTNQSAISLIENCKQNATIDIIIKINTYWNISFDWLLLGKGDMITNQPNSNNKTLESLFEWIDNLSEKEKIWLSVDMAYKYPNYKVWLEENNKTQY